MGDGVVVLVLLDPGLPPETLAFNEYEGGDFIVDRALCPSVEGT